MKCPICRKEMKRDNPEFPFCSERCRTIDLGNWASGKYVIPSPLSPAEKARLAEETEENEP